MPTDAAIKNAPRSVGQIREMPLDDKLWLANERIKDWYEFHEGKVFISYSGGKDSELLLHLVRLLYKDIPAVHAATGLEYPQITKHVLEHDNVVIVRPKKTYREVIDEYGYPVVSKRVSRYVSDLRKPIGVNAATQNLRLTGMTRNGKFAKSMILPKKWRFLVDAPFKISNQCCEVIKKEPLKRYHRETGRFPYVGTTASESMDRMKVWLKVGCNQYNAKSPLSAPLSMFTEQDVLACIRRFGLKMAPVYGKIVENADGTLRVTGEPRTGCMFCMFGAHLEPTPNRFQRMKSTHPQLHAFCMDKLGLRPVCKFVGIEVEPSPFEA